ncbi:MAG: rubrerythrin family protein [Endomicrobium sp.]|jgi:rubrerythrin|nr:rubrerythrin family protein [Endomicrobium sp.]
MTSVKKTETEKNLLKSFIGESCASMKYTLFSSIAKKDGFEQISSVFTETAGNEKEHAKRFYSFLDEGSIEIKNIFDVDTIGSTIDNLKTAAIGENIEYTKIYPIMATIADKEGFHDIAKCFRKIAVVEQYHESVYLKLIKRIETGFFKNKDIVKWKCRNCGYVYESQNAFEICPVCLHNISYMEKLQ